LLERLHKDIWRMEIPLPGNPLKSINSYVIKSDKRNLIIDTGLHMDVCRETFLNGLKDLAVPLHKTDIFITHMHADHFALLTKITLPEETRVMIGAKDGERLSNWTGWQQLFLQAVAHGFPTNELAAEVDTNPFLKLDLTNIPSLTFLDGDEVFHVGEYELHCLPTPGHTEGHICLFEPTKKFLFSGDHILNEISPNIIGWQENRNPLDEYLQSLELELFAKDIDLVFPGHRKQFTGCRQRIEQLKSHHKRRAAEALLALGPKGRTAYEVAPLMTWDFSVKNWKDWPIVQRWFATGEALAHLKFLVKEGRALQIEENGKILFVEN